MSQSGLQFRGRPVSQKDRGQQSTDYRFYSYCGGGGASNCVDPLGIQGIVLEYRVSNYGILIATNGGPDLFCSNSVGTYVDCHMGLSAVPDADLESTAKAGGVVLNGLSTVGAMVEFDHTKCPQPFLPGAQGGGPNPDWDAKIYVYLWWGDVSYVNGLGDFADGGSIDARAFNIVKHDNDVRM